MHESSIRESRSYQKKKELLFYKEIIHEEQKHCLRYKKTNRLEENTLIVNDMAKSGGGKEYVGYVRGWCVNM
jgi:hypothetical protein